MAATTQKYNRDLDDKNDKWEKHIAKMEADFFKLKPGDNRFTFSDRQVFDTGSVSVETNGAPLSSRNSVNPADNPLYIETANGGSKFHIQFHLEGFTPREISVKTDSRTLFVHAKHEENKNGTRRSCKEYDRKVALPKDVDPNTLSSFMSEEGVLTIEAPILPDYNTVTSGRLSLLSKGRLMQNKRNGPRSFSHSTLPRYMSENRLCSSLQNGHIDKKVYDRAYSPTLRSPISFGRIGSPVLNGDKFKDTVLNGSNSPVPELVKYTDAPGPQNRLSMYSTKGVPSFRRSLFGSSGSVGTTDSALGNSLSGSAVMSYQEPKDSLRSESPYFRFSPGAKSDSSSQFAFSPTLQRRNGTMSSHGLSSGEEEGYGSLRKDTSQITEADEVEPRFHTPIITNTEEGRKLRLVVDVGPLFKPEDIVVKTTGDKITLEAYRFLTRIGRSSRTGFKKEVKLPEAIFPNTLKALVNDKGRLTLSALVNRGG